MRRFLLFVLACVLLSSSAFAVSRWVLDIKSGAGAGLIGVGTELEWSGFGVWLATGISEGAVGMGLGLRWYFSPEMKSRGFVGPIVGSVTAGPLTLPYVGVTGGYEWRISPRIRLTLEAGLAYLLIIPLPLLGLALGWVF